MLKPSSHPHLRQMRMVSVFVCRPCCVLFMLCLCLCSILLLESSPTPAPDADGECVCDVCDVHSLCCVLCVQTRTPMPFLKTASIRPSICIFFKIDLTTHFLPIYTTQVVSSLQAAPVRVPPQNCVQTSQHLFLSHTLKTHYFSHDTGGPKSAGGAGARPPSKLRPDVPEFVPTVTGAAAAAGVLYVLVCVCARVLCSCVACAVCVLVLSLSAAAAQLSKKTTARTHTNTHFCMHADGKPAAAVAKDEPSHQAEGNGTRHKAKRVKVEAPVSGESQSFPCSLFVLF